MENQTLQAFVPEAGTRPFESLPVLLTVTRDQQIAQLGFVPSRMEARLIP
jgi:hypothetical protein